MNLSLDQHLPPSNVPKTSGGFLSRYPTNPSKLKSLREPVDVSKTRNGASNKLVVDLERAKSPTALERRIALDKAMTTESPFTIPAFDPSQSQSVAKVKKTNPHNKQKNSLIGGLGNQLLTNRSLDALAKVVTKRETQETQTEPMLVQIDFPDISGYQKWSKESIDPLMRDLRKALLTNRPEEIGMFLEAYGKAMCEGKELPVCKLPSEIWVNEPPETAAEGTTINQSVKSIGKTAQVTSRENKK
jgi:hypothetical protein